MQIAADSSRPKDVKAFMSSNLTGYRLILPQPRLLPTPVQLSPVGSNAIARNQSITLPGLHELPGLASSHRHRTRPHSTIAAPRPTDQVQLAPFLQEAPANPEPPSLPSLSTTLSGATSPRTHRRTHSESRYANVHPPQPPFQRATLEVIFRASAERIQSDLLNLRTYCARALTSEVHERELWKARCLAAEKERDDERNRIKRVVEDYTNAKEALDQTCEENSQTQRGRKRLLKEAEENHDIDPGYQSSSSSVNSRLLSQSNAAPTSHFPYSYPSPTSESFHSFQTHSRSPQPHPAAGTQLYPPSPDSSPVLAHIDLTHKVKLAPVSSRPSSAKGQLELTSPSLKKRRTSRDTFTPAEAAAAQFMRPVSSSSHSAATNYSTSQITSPSPPASPIPTTSWSSRPSTATKCTSYELEDGELVEEEEDMKDIPREVVIHTLPETRTQYPPRSPSPIEPTSPARADKKLEQAYMMNVDEKKSVEVSGETTQRKRSKGTTFTANSESDCSGKGEEEVDVDVSHVDLLYAPVNGRLVCRVCLTKYKRELAALAQRQQQQQQLTPTSSTLQNACSVAAGVGRPLPPTSFPAQVTWDTLRVHCVMMHKDACREVARLSPAQVSEARKKLTLHQGEAR